MSERQKKATLEMLNDVKKWPREVLCLCRRTGRLEVGYVAAGLPQLYIGSIFTPAPAEGRPIIEYESFEALVDDNWVLG